MSPSPITPKVGSYTDFFCLPQVHSFTLTTENERQMTGISIISSLQIPEKQCRKTGIPIGWFEGPSDFLATKLPFTIIDLSGTFNILLLFCPSIP
mgnify:CR=1 FL=1